MEEEKAAREPRNAPKNQFERVSAILFTAAGCFEIRAPILHRDRYPVQAEGVSPTVSGGRLDDFPMKAPNGPPETREDASHKTTTRNIEYETDKIFCHCVNARWHIFLVPTVKRAIDGEPLSFTPGVAAARRRVSLHCRPLRSFDQAEVRWPFRPAQCLTRAPQRTAAAWSLGRRRPGSCFRWSPGAIGFNSRVVGR